MSSFAVRSLIISSTTESTSTSTGAIVCAGGIGISGNVSVGGNVVTGGTISGNILSTSSTLTLTDGLNAGTISQLGPSLTLSSSGNKIAIAANNSLVFKNDGTTQLTGYTAREIVDDCDAHTYIYNTANPSTLKYMLSSTFAMNQGAPTTRSVTATNTYACQIRLIKGQVVAGAGFYLFFNGTATVYYALYNTDSPASRLAVTAPVTETTLQTAKMNYINYSTPYTVPTTGIYYTCIYVGNTGTGLNLIAMPGNSYLNYGVDGLIPAGTLTRASQFGTTDANGPPVTMSGVTMVSAGTLLYSVVYTL